VGEYPFLEFNNIIARFSLNWLTVSYTMGRDVS